MDIELTHNIELFELFNQTDFGLLDHHQCYADNAITPSSLHGVFFIFQCCLFINEYTSDQEFQDISGTG